MTETNGRRERQPGPGPTYEGAKTWGVVLLAHGSQRGTSREECSCSWESPDGNSCPAWCRDCPSTPQGLRDAAGRLQAALEGQGAEVILSCLEFIQPHPDQAIHQLAERGLGRVVIMPYLLGNGKHATLELDEALEELRSDLPQLDLQLSGGLGYDPRLADLVVERARGLEAALPHLSATGGDAGVLVVKAGTKTQYDDCLWLHDLGKTVEKQLGLGYAVAVAQSHYGDPTMEEAARCLVEERGVSSIICVPYLFFPGMILRRNILGGMSQLKLKYPEVSMGVAPPLGVDERLVAIAADRVREVWERSAAGGP